MIQRRDGERGGLIVVVSLCILGIALTIGLAVETFRLLTSHLQMQNVAEYASEVVLAEMVPGPIDQTRSAAQVSTVVNANQFMAQGANDVVDSTDVCFNNLGCANPVKVLTGCYNTVTFQFSCMTLPSCTGANVASASLVRISTFNKRTVALVFARMFGFSEINMSASALSFLNGSVFMTGPPKPDVAFVSCG